MISTITFGPFKLVLTINSRASTFLEAEASVCAFQHKTQRLSDFRAIVQAKIVSVPLTW